MDLDKCTFKSDRALNLALERTLQNIKQILDVNLEPTVIWSGNGYHIYLVLDSNGIVLENVKQLADIKIDRISLRFLRFAESYLSHGKSDRQHNTTVSFNNSMMRVPGSINSKNNCQVRIIQKWNPIGKRPAINYLLADFVGYLVNEKAHELTDAIKARAKFKSKFRDDNLNQNSINWIEQLIQTPLADHRKYCIWRILTPYLLNIKKMPEQKITDIIKGWLESCSKLRRLDFNAGHRIREGLQGAADGYLPMSFDKLKEENPELFSLYLDNIL